MTDFKKQALSITGEDVVAIRDLTLLTRSTLQNLQNNHGLKIKKRDAFVAVNLMETNAVRPLGKSKLIFIGSKELDAVTKNVEKTYNQTGHTYTKNLLSKLMDIGKEFKKQMTINKTFKTIMKFREEKGLQDGDKINLEELKNWFTQQKDNGADVELDEKNFYKFIALS